MAERRVGWDSEKVVLSHIMSSYFAKCVAFDNWMMRNVEERTQGLGLSNLLTGHYELSTWFCLSFAV